MVPILLMMMLIIALACDDSRPVETQEDAFAVGDSPRLVVSGFNGGITVNSGEDGVILVKATFRRPERINYEVSQVGATVTALAESKGSGFGFNKSPNVNFEISVPVKTEVELHTSNGRIEVFGIKSNGRLRTSNGRIVIENAGGEFNAHTSNGAIVVTSFRGALVLGTSNGGITFDGELLQDSRNEMTTSNGSVQVTLRGTPNMDIDASTSHGTVTIRLPLAKTILLTSTQLIGTIGEGGAVLTIRSSNGSIVIR